MAKYLDPKADLTTIQIPTYLLEDKNVSKALELVKESAYTEDELYTIDRYWDAVSRERTALCEKFDQGVARGREEGIAIGEERGIAIGEERGEARGIAIGEERREQERISNITRMRSKGYDNATIADLLDLDIEYIKQH